MATQMSDKQLQELRGHVQQLLNQECQRRRVDFMLRIVDEAVLEEEFLHFVVVPDHEGIRAWDYADILTNVEMHLRRDEHVENVLLVPALPD
jgi:hypothetical protein